jgi:hypothetical protein
MSPLCFVHQNCHALGIGVSKSHTAVYGKSKSKGKLMSKLKNIGKSCRQLPTPARVSPPHPGSIIMERVSGNRKIPEV